MRFHALLSIALVAATTFAATVDADAGGSPNTSPASKTVTLLTGERVSVRLPGGGKATAHVIRTSRPGLAGAATIEELGTDIYVLPTIARPYLGRFLDQSLFDASAQARRRAASTVPVTISFQGSTAPSVPGVVITNAHAGTAAGYLTASSAAVFGQALMRQYASDAKSGWPARTTLFGSVTRISAAAAPVVGATPDFPMRTLIINVLDGAGAKVPGALMSVMNVDDARKFETFVPVIDGQARISVPVGHYAGLVEVDAFDPNTFTGEMRMVPFDDYAVSTGNQVLTLDARRATSTLSVQTPRAANLVTGSWEWDRFAAGQTGGIQASAGAGRGAVIRTAPVAAPPASLGTLNSLTTWSLSATPASGRPYTYDLAFAANGVPATQRHTVRSAELETVSAGYHTDGGAKAGAYLRSAVLPFQFFVGGFLNPLSLPVARTEYVQDTPGAVWSSVLLPDVSLNDPFVVAWLDGLRHARGGRRTRADWLAGPLTPAVPFVTDGNAPGTVLCSACRVADAMELFFAPATDSTPGHMGSVALSADGTPVARLRVYAGTKLLFDQNDSAGGAFAAPAGQAAYRVVYNVDRRAGGAALSTTTNTVWTFGSAGGKGRPIPSRWVCDLGATCTIPPILDAAVGLPGDLTGRAAFGTSTLTVSLGHIQGAPNPAIAWAECDVRVGAGAWRRLARTTLGAGRYAFAFTATAAQAGQGVDVRVSGADVNGDGITQTTTRAFAIAAS